MAADRPIRARQPPTWLQDYVTGGAALRDVDSDTDDDDQPGSVPPPPTTHATPTPMTTATAAATPTVTWCYQTQRFGWVAIPASVQQEMERRYSEGSFQSTTDDIRLRSGVRNDLYAFHFNDMKQVNLSTNRERKIRRQVS